MICFTDRVKVIGKWGKSLIFAIMLLFLMQIVTMAHCSEITFKKTLFYKINFGSNPYLGYTKDIENSKGTCPYNIISDFEGNIWIVDRAGKQCMIITKEKNIKVFMKGDRFYRIDKKYGFNILAIDKNRLLLGSCILSKKKEILLNFKRCLGGIDHLSSTLVASSGFTGDNGVFINQIDFLLITDGNANTVLSIPLWKVLPIKDDKTQIISYYYDPFKNRGYYVKFYKRQLYLVDNRQTVRFNIDRYRAYHILRFIDQKGRFYLSDSHFKVEGDAEHSVMIILDPHVRILSKITLNRTWKKNSGEQISREDVIGITPDGNIYITEYITGKGIKIYRLSPVTGSQRKSK